MPSALSPHVIGITGQIAAGKSFVGRAIIAEADRRDLRHLRLDADDHARRAVERPETLRQIRERFGDGCFDGDRLDRVALGRIVFAEDGSSARAELEAIIHPVVRRDMIERWIGASPLGVVVLDVPLLIESGWDLVCDDIVCVTASTATRRRRAAARGWAADELENREKRQLGLSVKLAHSTIRVENDADDLDDPFSVLLADRLPLPSSPSPPGSDHCAAQRLGGWSP